MTDTANTKKTAKPRGKPWPKGTSGNPKGRPADGQSWSAIIKGVTNLTAAELAALVGGNKSELGKQIAKFPQGVPLKILVIARVVSALMFDPNSALLRVLVDAEQIDDLEARISALENSGLFEGKDNKK